MNRNAIRDRSLLCQRRRVFKRVPTRPEHSNRSKFCKSTRCNVGNVAGDILTYNFSSLTGDDIDRLCKRPHIDFKSITNIVEPIIESVKKNGDEAVRNYTTKFDRVHIDELVFRPEDLPEPVLDPQVKLAFDTAYSNIVKFHQAQMPKKLEVETMPGVECSRVFHAISSVGLYVPGGTAVLPSTALMLAIPAQIAGCKTRVLATPPRSDGSICPEVLYVAQKTGVTHILRAGGAQAVAAMSIGTETCPKVHKIFGPGNQFVTAAKMLIQNSEAMCSIDMPAGPSEVLVIADASSNPKFVASDLLSQAEHGADSQVVLVAVAGFDAPALLDEVSSQIKTLPRGEMASKALLHSYIVNVNSIQEACDFSNKYAPEHLIINVDNPELYLDSISDAGSVFCGPWTPESVGDYASGTNHVLPTYGYARMHQGVSLVSFMKSMTVQTLTKNGLQTLGPHVALMAEVEGLNAHQRAVTLRLDSLK